MLNLVLWLRQLSMKRPRYLAFYKNEDTITLTVVLDEADLTVTADFSTIDSEYTAGDEDVSLTETTYTITYAISTANERADGEYTIIVTAADAAGNTTDDSCSVSLDNTVPVITDAAAAPSQLQPGEAYDVGFSAVVDDGEGSGIATITINLSDIGGSPTQTMEQEDGTNVYSYTLEGLNIIGEGTYELTITATDNLGNVNADVSITLTVVADTDPPVISDPAIEYPFGLSSAMPGDNVTITVTIIDDIAMGVVTANSDAFETGITLTLEEGDLYTGVAVINSATTKGDYSLTINATDAAGNPATPDESLKVRVRSEATGFEIDLVEGWNLISLPLIPDDSDITVIISSDTISTGDVSSIGIVRAYDPATGEFPYYMPSDGSGELAEMVDGVGYWVFMNEDATLTVTGLRWPTPPAVPPSYDVIVGWNLIGFKSLADDSAASYLANIEGTYPVLWIYDATAGKYVNVKDAEDGMIAGHGFWIWVTEAGTIVPPQ